MVSPDVLEIKYQDNVAGGNAMEIMHENSMEYSNLPAFLRSH
jgi:hypothetical protein